jgi:hypothetical protein
MKMLEHADSLKRLLVIPEQFFRSFSINFGGSDNIFLSADNKRARFCQYRYQEIDHDQQVENRYLGRAYDGGHFRAGVRPVGPPHGQPAAALLHQ